MGESLFRPTYKGSGPNSKYYQRESDVRVFASDVILGPWIIPVKASKQFGQKWGSQAKMSEVRTMSAGQISGQKVGGREFVSPYL